jgi:hypothetical protein
MTIFCKLGRMVRFLIVELIHSDSNPRFDVSVAYLRLIILLVVGDVDSETLFDRLHKSQDQAGSVFQICL